MADNSSELLQQAIKGLSIQHVILREVHQTMSDDFEPVFTETQLSIQMKANCLSLKFLQLPNEDDGQITIARFRYECGIRMIDPSQQNIDSGNPTTNQTVIEITAIFNVDYHRANNDIPSEAMEEFARLNVGYHVWPYWRELVQSLCTRAGLPAPIVPFYTRPKS